VPTGKTCGGRLAGEHLAEALKFSRADRSRLADWWFTVDRGLLAAVFVLLVTGLVLSLSASPEVAVRKGLEPFHFFQRHALFSLAGVVVLIGLSLLQPSAIRRFALFLLIAMLALTIWVLAAGSDVNGARRWLLIGGMSFQPSELFKPAFVVIAAWLFAEIRNRPDMPAFPLAAGLLAVSAGLLLAQPDVGQAFMLTAVWGGLYLLAGLALQGVLVLAGLGIAGLAVAYVLLDHVRQRIDAFLLAAPQEHSQAARAMQSFIEGGFLGRGPGEGTIKSHFPDAHTDFIFAVIAEEYGVLAGLGLLAVFAFIVLRALFNALNEGEPATRLAIQGLALVLAMQVLINVGVNVGLLPAKGMTLPYISSGGSSHLGISVTLGMLLALTRRRVNPPRVAMRPNTTGEAASRGCSGLTQPGRLGSKPGLLRDVAREG